MFRIAEQYKLLHVPARTLPIYIAIQRKKEKCSMATRFYCANYNRVPIKLMWTVP